MAHEYFMELALEQALIAQSIGEVPVGAVVVDQNSVVIGEGYNQCISKHDPSMHAEMVAIRNACQSVKNYRLVDVTLYVTLEPCSMCAGLLVHSRIKTLVFGAKDRKTGAAGSVFNLVQHPDLNHSIEVVSGVLEARCSSTLSDFFALRREEKKRLKKAAKKLP